MSGAAAVGRRALRLLGDARAQGSPSPRLHDAVFGSGTYTVHVADDAGAAFSAAEACCRGVNVTAPFKVAAAQRYAEVLDDRARACGAVNTVVYDDDGRPRVAANTDVVGVLVAWRRAGFVVDGHALAVVGAGGAARAVVLAAAEARASGVIVHARRSEAAAALVALAAQSGLDAMAASAVDDGRADLVVVAASDLDDPAATLRRALRPGGAVHDLRYGARARPLRDAALRAGARFADGSTMLLAQAEEAAALFAGRPLALAERDRMRDALAAWLREGATAG
jgi:shikimate dehydrogenase